MLNLLDRAFWFLAQQNGGGAAAPPADGNAPPGGFDFWTLAPLLLIGLLFYVMLVLPERRKRKEMQNVLESLKENDQVVTIGGLVGTIVQFSKGGEEVVLRVDEKTNTKVRVLRSAIARPLKTGDDAAKEDKKDEGRLGK